MLLKSKQIDKILSGRIRIDGLSVTSGNSSETVTSALTTALSAASNTGGSIPLQPSASTLNDGVITTGDNVAFLVDNTSKVPITDGNGNELYARLTESTSVYTLSFYSLVNGVETAYTFNANTDIDFEFGYRFKFVDYPADAAISVKSRNIADDPSAGAIGFQSIETLTVTALNTISALANTTNVKPSRTIFYVNGQAIVNGDGISTDTSGSITVTPATLGYNVETTDAVRVEYWYGG